ncbi:ABC transporter permease [Gordonia sihwensis]|uniref:ABC transporter permease n=1 Tax=Gordonia sihwensis TaxID=173559 RepID=UPI001C92CCC3|nr:FtsX-like permease family protein [Gordonia sihwensis]MBY4570264.1 ABC transporter permease [Gordonia sihwensis]
MYLGLREFRAAAGRFALVVGVVTLLAFMVVALSALTEGLRQQSVSAVEKLPGAALLVQEDGDKPALLSDSEITRTDGEGTELGVATLRASHDGANSTVAVFGRGDVHEVAVSPDIAKTLGVVPGGSIQLGSTTVRVDRVADVGQYAHQQVISMPVGEWREVTHRDSVNALIVDSDSAAPAGLVRVAHADLPDLVPGFSSEHMSLLLIQGLLVVISAVVVCGFFAVWTGQRIGSLAVVRAMGAGRWYLLRDGLAQAGSVLVVGLALGAALAVGFASLLSGKAPVVVDPAAGATVLAGMAVLGLVGAALALRPLVKVDPLVALNR